MLLCKVEVTLEGEVPLLTEAKVEANPPEVEVLLDQPCKSEYCTTQDLYIKLRLRKTRLQQIYR